MLGQLPILIVTSLHLSAVTDARPQFDIARECQFEAGSSKAIRRTCIRDEKRARHRLEKQWAEFSPYEKAWCTREVSRTVARSYVELLTCLQMEKHGQHTLK